MAGRIRPRRATTESLPQRGHPPRAHGDPQIEPAQFAHNHNAQPSHQTYLTHHQPCPLTSLMDVQGGYHPPPPLHETRFQPDSTSTPISQIPPYTPSPPVCPGPPMPATRGTRTGQDRNKHVLPFRRGILKNSFIEPFYPSLPSMTAASAASAAHSVRFRSTPDQRFMSPQWSSESSPNMGIDYPPAQSSEPMRFHDRFAMTSRGSILHGFREPLQQTTSRPVTVGRYRVPTPLVRAHHDLVHS